MAGARQERTDQKIAETDHGGDDAIAIDPACWPALRPHLADLLDLVERDGVAVGMAWLAANEINCWPGERSGKVT